MQHSYVLQAAALDAFAAMLTEQERSSNTVGKYLRDAQAFFRFLPAGGTVDKETVIAYKKQLAERYKTASANSMLVAVNALLAFLGWRECRVKLLKVQRQSFRDVDRELTRTEYLRLVDTARRQHNERLCFLLQAICSTGLRVSEHRFITVEAVRQGVARVCNKGKERTVFLPEALQRPLLQFCRQQGLESGPVFITRNGRPMDRSNIWTEMKRLCHAAGVASQKVFPHNLRHLFALTYYKLEKDVIRLADILGHTSVETTRIYTATSGLEQRRQLSRMQLVCSG